MTSRPASPGGGGLDAAVRGSLRGGGSAPRAPMRASVAQRHVQRMRQSNATIAGGPQDEASDYAEYLRQSLARDDGPLAPPPLVKPAESTGTGPVLSFVRKTTKYWVQPCDMDELKRVVGDSLPAFQFNQDLDSDSQLCNSVYLDNADKELYKQRMNKTPGALAIRLRWYDVSTLAIPTTARFPGISLKHCLYVVRSVSRTRCLLSARPTASRGAAR